MVLKEISNFQTNWNGYGADPLPVKSIERAYDFIVHSKYPCEVFPTMYDCVRIEFYSIHGKRLELDIPANGNVKYAIRNNDRCWEYLEIEYSIENISHIIEKFMNESNNI